MLIITSVFMVKDLSESGVNGGPATTFTNWKEPHLHT